MALEKSRLDKNRPYGIVYGTPGIAFEQDGVHYSGNEQPVEQWTTAENLDNERAIAQKRLAREAQLARARQIAQDRKRAREDE